MSLKELEKQIQQLPKPDLEKFGEWFDEYRECSGLAADQQAEVLRRQSEYLANPSTASLWDDGFFDRLRQRLADARPQKTSDR